MPQELKRTNCSIESELLQWIDSARAFCFCTHTHTHRKGIFDRPYNRLLFACGSNEPMNLLKDEFVGGENETAGDYGRCSVKRVDANLRQLLCLSILLCDTGDKCKNASKRGSAERTWAGRRGPAILACVYLRIWYALRTTQREFEMSARNIV